MVSAEVRLKALEEFNRALGNLLPLSDVVRLAVDKARMGTGAEAAELFLLDESTGQSCLVCHRGLYPQAFRQITRFPPGEGYPGLVATLREAIATDNLPRDPRYLRTQVKDRGFLTYFCLPLCIGDVLLGCLNVAARHGKGITPEDRQFLEGIGSPLSLALEAGRWQLAEALAHWQAKPGEAITLEEAAADALDTIATMCHASGAVLIFHPSQEGPQRLLGAWGVWREIQLPPAGLPKGCPALHYPRFSPCPEGDCPFSYGTSVCHPLHCGGERLGIFSVGYRERHPTEAFFLFPRVAPLLGVGLEKLRDYHLAQERGAGEERRRLVQELHDGVVQTLGLLRVRAEYLSRLVEQGGHGLAEALEEQARLAGDVIEELRRVLYSQPPVELERDGLVVSLHNLACKLAWAYQIPVQVKAHGMVEALTPGEQANLLRIAQEGLSNALRHSGARRVEVELSLEPSGCRLLVRDDGQGFDPRGSAGGMGLSSMEQRARSLGGMLVIDSAPGRGTTLQVWLPSRG